MKGLDGEIILDYPMGPNSNHNCAYERKTERIDMHERKRHRHTGEKPHEHEAEIGAMWPQAKACWCHQDLEEAGRTLPVTSEGTQPRGHLDFESLLPRTVRGYIYFV